MINGLKSKTLLRSHKKTHSTFVDFSCFAISGFKLNSRKAERLNGFFYRLCSCRHCGDNNLSVGLFDELSVSSGHICVFLTTHFLKTTSDILGKKENGQKHSI